MSKFKVGDKVRKVTGYPFKGVVCAAYETEEKCCVKHKDKWEHIFSDKQLDYDHPEYEYLDLLKEVLEEGVEREGRNGGTRSLFGRQIRFNLNEGFPLLTTKKIHVKSVVGELIWFMRGDTHIQYLRDNNITIWDEWAADDVHGSVGNMYGAQWRYWVSPSKVSFHQNANGNDHVYVTINDNLKAVKGFYGFGTIDQLGEVVESIRKDPYSRRHIVSAWNPNDVKTSALPPCHILYQFYVNDGKLSCHLYQRSADLFLGVPFNIASYSLLTHLVARETGLGVGELIISFGDVHLYNNHIEQAQEQLTRTPLLLPHLYINSDKSMFDLEINDIDFRHYFPHPTIKAPVSK